MAKQWGARVSSCCPFFVTSSRHESVVLIVDPSIGRTGALLCSGAMAKALPDKVCVEIAVPVCARFLDIDIDVFSAVHQFSFRNPGRSPSSILSWLWSLAVSSIQLRVLLRQRRISHLVINDWYLLQGILCRLLGYNGTILTWVRLDPWRFGKWRASLLFRLIHASSDRIVVVSRHVQQRLPAGVPSTLLYDALPQPALQAHPDRGQCIVCIGNYTPGKGQDLALEAFARIAERFPRAHLRFYGDTLGRETNRRWLDSLTARAEQLGLASRVDFHGFAADPRPLLQDASVSLNLSQAESFSLTVLEACAAGLAVIATDCGGPAEIILHRKTGILVPLNPSEDTIRAASQALDELLGSPELASRLGRAARQRIDADFSQRSYKDGLHQVLGFA